MKIGIISDIHEDIISLQKALTVLEKHNCDELVCLGDITGFNVPNYNYLETRNATECLRLVRENCRYIIKGNHDLFAIREVPNFTADFDYPSNWYDLDFYERKLLSNNKLWLYEEDELSSLISLDDKFFIKSLPDLEIVEFDEIHFLFSHFAFPDISGTTKTFIFFAEQLASHFEFLNEKCCEIAFIGHTHTEGIGIATKNKLDIMPFGQYKIPVETTCILSPCVAQGKKKNGVLIFDTLNFTIEAISL